MTGTPTETSEGGTTDTQEGIGYLPPCREAEKFMTHCPRCNRMLKLKTLRYSHCCLRSFDPAQRAIEQQVLADKAVNVRMASLEQRASQHASQHAEMQRQAEYTRTRDYSKLVSFK